MGDECCGAGHDCGMTLVSPISERRRRMDRRAPDADPLAAQLSYALTADAIEVLFQPQYATASQQVMGAEALARWRHPQLGEIRGDELFRIAASAGMVRQVSDHVMDQALQAAARWPAHLRLSLNITAGDLATPGFPDIVAAALCRNDFAPERLTLEITEQALVADLDRSAERLTQLVDLGIKVALDDFGAGFCNFRYLKILPLHTLKLDRSMIEGVAEDRRDLEVLRGIVALAGALDLSVVAEGIETEGQLAAIASVGCASWQGYLGAKPMHCGEFAALAAR
jgi:EAL domain-containing protein (putative c-di-GMP-specific phosphodiesterase class I)